MTRVQLLASLAVGAIMLSLAPPASAEEVSQCMLVAREHAQELKSQGKDFFIVIAPNKIQLKKNIGYEIVKTKDGKEFVRLWSTLNGEKARAEAEAEAGYECECDGSCGGECKVDGGGSTLTCQGGCYEGTSPCTSCHWHYVIEM